MAIGTKSPGVWVPVATPFGLDLEPDAEAFVAHCKDLLRAGADGLAVFGTTSEANSLGLAERKGLLEALVDSGVDPKRLMPGTGCCALTDTVDLTGHAVRLGCTGVLMLPPFYYKGVGDEGLFTAFAEVIERVADDRLRIFLYHIPPVAQVPISLDLLQGLTIAYPSIIAGLKDSSGDWRNTETVIETLPQLAVFSGSERTVLANIRAGGAGCISATANVNVRNIRRLIDRWQSAEAESMQEDLNAVRSAFERYPMIAAIKAFLLEATGNGAWSRLRPPLTELPVGDRRDLMRSLGFASGRSGDDGITVPEAPALGSRTDNRQGPGHAC